MREERSRFGKLKNRPLIAGGVGTVVVRHVGSRFCCEMRDALSNQVFYAVCRRIILVYQFSFLDIRFHGRDER
jgi:hypothetical protein